MTVLKGTSVFGGLAFGKIMFYKRGDSVVRRHRVDDVNLEVSRFEKAKETAVAQLKELYDKAIEEVGEADAMIFEIHQMMLDDGDYLDSITNIITTQNVNAEYAVAKTGENFAQMFASMDDEYMRGRASDVKDISTRVISVLSGNDQTGLQVDEPIILAADDLAPSETMQLDKEKILAFVTMGGSTSSHTAILARMMNIPAIIGLGEDLIEEFDGKEAIVDGIAGMIYIEPDEETRLLLKKKADAEKEKKRLLDTLRGKENKTLDGKTIDIFANIGGVTDVAIALQNDAGGVGLFRSEFLYLKSEDYPTENEQFQAYKTVAETMGGRKVVIRTLDIGADKQIDYFDLPKEENPALGYRAVRICLDRTEIFKTQLRALYRASAFGNISIMIPMIISVEEVRQVKNIINEIKMEMDEAGITYSPDVEVGIMIETPASVVISDLLAKEVDFFSIGTNDLTQYTLAIDRQNPKLTQFYNPHHTAILRMIKTVADNAHKEGKWVGICGELAADLELAETFLAMGIDELSVSPPYILPLRDKVRQCNVLENGPEILNKL